MSRHEHGGPPEQLAVWMEAGRRHVQLVRVVQQVLVAEAAHQDTAAA